jgi:hypothetical protein
MVHERTAKGGTSVDMTLVIETTAKAGMSVDMALVINRIAIIIEDGREAQVWAKAEVQDMTIILPRRGCIVIMMVVISGGITRTQLEIRIIKTNTFLLPTTIAATTTTPDTVLRDPKLTPGIITISVNSDDRRGDSTIHLPQRPTRTLPPGTTRITLSLEILRRASLVDYFNTEAATHQLTPFEAPVDLHLRT